MSCRPRLAVLRLTRRPLGSRYASTKKLGRLWTEEPLKSSSKYPLSVELAQDNSTQKAADKLQNSITKDTIHSHRLNLYMRTQIVSPSLCDDVLEYIGHSLEKYRGCDIIDLNPGVGLWSQKLHEFLQPRTHILFESSERFDPYLNPLIDKPGSTYKLFRGNAAVHKDIDELVASGLLPHQKRVRHGDANAQEPNNSLLVTGTLLWDPKLPGIGFDSMVKQLLVQWGAKAWSNEVFHSFGPVRSLFWGANDDLIGCIPRAAGNKTKYSFYMSMLAKNTQVVTAPQTYRSAGRSAGVGREAQYAIRSLAEAMRRGRDNGMMLPVHRRENVHTFAEEIDRLTDGTARLSSQEMHDYLKEKEMAGFSTLGLSTEANIALFHAHEDMKKHPDKYIKKSPPGTKGDGSATREARAWAVKRANAKRVKIIKNEVEIYAQAGEELYDLECQALGMQDGPEKETVLAAIQEKDEKVQFGLESVDILYRTGISSEIDDRISLRDPVQRLEWDHRPYEPLITHPDEVWPQSRVGLIDSTPRPAPPGVDLDWFEWIQDFVHGLLTFPTASVTAALEHLQPGASQLVEEAPSLHDPKKGGRKNLEHLRTRMMTTEMVNELYTAYENWPFKDQDANHTKYFRLRSGHAGPSRVG
ncbi:S-adenosyl-L-methionine-dependent methyltransferase [Massarina eburnea CBS 473.64]|uniref:Mitochondrial transcription factor 1 n=1 Tax=Massarina eburnea CBS 473.64 TaxID=1395130 RepID=A0A6A6S1S0_9PLEO|nr:S-adenosyl-L-methionine-dependent methyltransferase [Massarina eburnea CBS 473.64]